MCSLIQRSTSARLIPVLLPVAGPPVLAMMVKDRPMWVSRNPSRFSERATRSACVVRGLAISASAPPGALGLCGGLQCGQELGAGEIRERPGHSGEQRLLGRAGDDHGGDGLGNGGDVGYWWSPSVPRVSFHLGLETAHEGTVEVALNNAPRVPLVLAFHGGQIGTFRQAGQ